jgi:hypothetical protein
MATLVTMAQAIGHLRLPLAGGSPTDIEDRDDVQLKLDQAEAIVLDRFEGAYDWTVETVPVSIQAAILEQLCELYRFRGDDSDRERPKQETGYLTPSIEAKIRLHKDPPLA